MLVTDHPMIWDGDRALAERYAALRHPAVARVSLEENDGHLELRPDPRPDAAPSLGSLAPVPPALALRALGEVTLGLAALREIDLAHGDPNEDAIHEVDGRFVLTGVAHPVHGDDSSADLRAAAATTRRLLGDAAAEPAVAALLADFDKDARPTADLARSALALATAPEPSSEPAPAPAAATADAAAVGGSDLDTARRRTRNRMILIGAVVVIIGALLLRRIDSHGIVTVPNEVGKPTAVATQQLRQAGLIAKVAAPATPAPAARPGTVLSQSPGAGSRVRPGRTVVLTATPPRSSDGS